MPPQCKTTFNVGWKRGKPHDYTGWFKWKCVALTTPVNITQSYKPDALNTTSNTTQSCIRIMNCMNKSDNANSMEVRDPYVCVQPIMGLTDMQCVNTYIVGSNTICWEKNNLPELPATICIATHKNLNTTRKHQYQIHSQYMQQMQGYHNIWIYSNDCTCMSTPHSLSSPWTLCGCWRCPPNTQPFAILPNGFTTGPMRSTLLSIVNASANNEKLAGLCGEFTSASQNLAKMGLRKCEVPETPFSKQNKAICVCSSCALRGCRAGSKYTQLCPLLVLNDWRHNKCCDTEWLPHVENCVKSIYLTCT